MNIYKIGDVIDDSDGFEYTDNHTIIGIVTEATDYPAPVNHPNSKGPSRICVYNSEEDVTYTIDGSADFNIIYEMDHVDGKNGLTVPSNV